MNLFATKTMWHLDADPCVECFTFHHITKYMIYTCPCMMILVVLIPRLVKVDYHLPAIEMKIPQIWDWSDDTSPHRHAEHPYSSNNLEYDGVVVFVKLLLLLGTLPESS